MPGPAKIVVVEDEEFQRQVIVECLSRNGVRPTALTSGAELKRLVQQSVPDLVLLNVGLKRSGRRLRPGTLAARAIGAHRHHHADRLR